MADYGIDGDIWPGLSKVAEEAAEVIVVINKIMAMGGDRTYFDGADLVIWLEEELGDLAAAIQFLTVHNPILKEKHITNRHQLKSELYESWRRP